MCRSIHLKRFGITLGVPLNTVWGKVFEEVSNEMVKNLFKKSLILRGFFRGVLIPQMTIKPSRFFLRALFVAQAFRLGAAKFHRIGVRFRARLGAFPIFAVF